MKLSMFLESHSVILLIQGTHNSTEENSCNHNTMEFQGHSFKRYASRTAAFAKSQWVYNCTLN